MKAAGAYIASDMQPFALTPVLVERPWGGRRLLAYGKELPSGAGYGESWEVADLPPDVAMGVPDPRSRVATGPFAGRALGEVARRYPRQLLGVEGFDGEFPLLVKLLDAEQNLSVQVHPHAAYAADHPEARLKTESWYVVEAEPDAELFLDLVPDVSRDRLRSVLGTPGVVDLLQRVPAHAGDFHHLPAGLVHALGAGVVVAEVQTPSDTTFRIYDWAEEYGREPRTLHPDEALATIVPSPEGYVSLPARSEAGSRLLTENAHYRIVEHRSERNVVRATLSDPGTPSIVMVVRGEATVADLAAARGTTVFVPATAGLDAMELAPGTTALEIGVPPFTPVIHP